MIQLMIVLGAGLLTTSAFEEDGLDRRQLAAVLRDLRAPIRDYEFLYEGREVRLKTIDAASLGGGGEIVKATERNPRYRAGSVVAYQGNYAYRGDQSFHLDISRRLPDPAEPPRRSIFRYFGDKGSHRLLIADRGGLQGPDSSQKMSLNFIKDIFDGPLRLDMTPYLQDRLQGMPKLRYECLGWEDVGGHRCLVVDLAFASPKSGERIWGQRYWIDLERGGCVLRYEQDDGGKVTNRLAEVRLSLLRTEDGREVWLPVSGKSLDFVNGFDIVAEPTVERTYEILAGTVRINRGLPDSRFSLDYGLDAQTRKLAEQFNTGARAPERGAPRNAEEALKQAIHDADDQAKRLVAVPAAERPWLARYWASAGLIAVGVGLFGLATYLRRRVA